MNSATDWLVWFLAVSVVPVLTILGYSYARYLQERRDIPARKGLPPADEIKKGLSPERRGQCNRLKYLPELLDIVEPKAKAGTLQEESVISALEGRMLRGVTWFRELSSIFILAALVITFFRLHQDLPKILSKRHVTAEDLAPIVPLVGANWPLIALGLLFYCGAALYDQIQLCRFKAYEGWLEADIFPHLGVSRSTSDQLAAALKQFTTTAATMNRSLAPLQQLGIVLSDFQTGLVNELVPAIKEGLQHVSIGLSDSAINKLTVTADSSAHVLRALQDQQARMLTIMTASERRTAELAATVDALAHYTHCVSLSLSKQAALLEASTSAADRLGTVVHDATEQMQGQSAALQASVSALEGSLDNQGRIIEAQAGVIREMITLMSDANRKLGGLTGSMELAVTQVKALDKTVMTFAALLDSVVGPLKALAAAVPDFATRVNDLQERWQEAMLQMTSLAEEVTKRTGQIDGAALQLTESIRNGVVALGTTTAQLGELVNEGEKMRSAVVQISDGSRQIVGAFSDLQSLGQKLKNLGHGITGHFAVWQKENKEVFRKAQDASTAIVGAIERMSVVISSLESSLNGSAALIQELSEIRGGLPLVFRPADTAASVPLDGGKSSASDTARGADRESGDIVPFSGDTDGTTDALGASPE
jgi:hypothetical protein